VGCKNLGLGRDYILLLISVISVSSAAILFRLSGAGGFTASMWRLGIGAIITLLITRYISGSDQVDINIRDRALMIISGIALSLHFSLWFTSLLHIRVGPSTVIVDAYPVVLALIGLKFFGERYTHIDVIGSIMAMAGLVGTVYTTYGYEVVVEGGDVVVGLASVVTSLAMVTLYFSVGRFLRTRISTWVYTSYVYSSAFLTSLLTATLFGEPIYPVDGGIIYLILLGIVPMIGGHTVINYLLARLRTLTVTIPIITEPILASILAYLILGEALPVENAIWILITVFGVSIVVYSEASRG